MTLSEKIIKFDDVIRKNWCDLKYDIMCSDTESKMHCCKCGHRLSVISMLIHCFRKKKGEKYYVICGKCEYVNKITKKVDKKNE